MATHAPSVSSSPSSVAAASPLTGASGSPMAPPSPLSLTRLLELGSDGLPRGVEIVRWEEERVLVFQMAVAGEVVARRVDNAFVNGTKLLNLAVLTRGRRDSQLKNVKDRQVVLKGPRNLKGVWIPLGVAQQLASRFNLLPRLGALLSNSLRCPAQSPDVPPPRPARAASHSANASTSASGLAARRGTRPSMVPMRKSAGNSSAPYGLAIGPMTAPASTDAGPSSHSSSFPWMAPSSAAAAHFYGSEASSPVLGASPAMPTGGAYYGGYMPVSYPPVVGYQSSSYHYPTSHPAAYHSAAPSSTYAALGQGFEAALHRGWAATSPFAGAPPTAPAASSGAAGTSSSAASSASSSAAPTVVTARTDGLGSPLEASQEFYASPPHRGWAPAQLTIPNSSAFADLQGNAASAMSPPWGTTSFHHDAVAEPMSAPLGSMTSGSSYFSSLPSPAVNSSTNMVNPYVPAGTTTSVPASAFKSCFVNGANPTPTATPMIGGIVDNEAYGEDDRHVRSLSEGEARRLYLTPAPSPFIPSGFDPVAGAKPSCGQTEAAAWEYLSAAGSESST